jgi:hypothetical protein
VSLGSSDHELRSRRRSWRCATSSPCCEVRAPKRLAFSSFDRLFFASLYRIAPGVVNALVIVKPETVIRWHRAGFRLFWRWKSRHRGGRPRVPLEIQPTRRRERKMQGFKSVGSAQKFLSMHAAAHNTSTSSVISPQQEHTKPSEHRPCRRGVKLSLRREPDVPSDLLRALSGNVTEPSKITFDQRAPSRHDNARAGDAR